MLAYWNFSTKNYSFRGFKPGKKISDNHIQFEAKTSKKNYLETIVAKNKSINAFIEVYNKQSLEREDQKKEKPSTTSARVSQCLGEGK